MRRFGERRSKHHIYAQPTETAINTGVLATAANDPTQRAEAMTAVAVKKGGMHLDFDRLSPRHLLADWANDYGGGGGAAAFTRKKLTCSPKPNKNLHRIDPYLGPPYDTKKRYTHKHS